MPNRNPPEASPPQDKPRTHIWEVTNILQEYWTDAGTREDLPVCRLIKFCREHGYTRRECKVIAAGARAMKRLRIVPDHNNRREIIYMRLQGRRNRRERQ